MSLTLYWIDAFASAPFSGNPAGVVPLESWPPDDVMQKIAFENGLAETAFFAPAPGHATASPHFHLRWFTPAVEVDLCGHATLASGHVVLRELGLAADAVTFHSRSGPLVVSRKGSLLELDFPPTFVAAEQDPQVVQSVARAVGQANAWVGHTRFDRVAVLRSAAEVAALAPDPVLVAAAGGRGLIVTAPGEDCDFVSRFFAPQIGIPEDPVTGSAHCALVPYWADRLGRTVLHARQLSKRGGELWCEWHPRASERGRVKMAGHATRYLRGELTLPPPSRI